MTLVFNLQKIESRHTVCIITLYLVWQMNYQVVYIENILIIHIDYIDSNID